MAHLLNYLLIRHRVHPPHLQIWILGKSRERLLSDLPVELSRPKHANPLAQTGLELQGEFDGPAKIMEHKRASHIRR
jgi:hypothetical protein